MPVGNDPDLLRCGKQLMTAAEVEACIYRSNFTRQDICRLLDITDRKYNDEIAPAVREALRTPDEDVLDGTPR